MFIIYKLDINIVHIADTRIALISHEKHLHPFIDIWIL